MGWGNNNPPPPDPHTQTWCELNPKRCKDNVPGASIESWFLAISITILISIKIHRKMKNKYTYTIIENPHYWDLIYGKDRPLTFEIIYDKISVFLFGYKKSFKWGELKGL